ncbi:MAG: proteinase inhibitor I4 serpin [Sphingobacteriia bacterium]|nr:proteinase inhibitor I4 serpin [Sphingobacteriia bacterium]
MVLFICCLVSVSSCQRNCLSSPRCSDRPNSGPCPDSNLKWYYDRVDNKCKSFTWGGCGGVVPFQTEVDCKKACKCKK